MVHSSHSVSEINTLLLSPCAISKVLKVYTGKPFDHDFNHFLCQATAAGDAIACIAFKGTIAILRQQKDLVGGSRNCLVLLTYSTVFVLWVSGSEKVQNYVDVI